MEPADAEEVFRRFEADDPRPGTELAHTNDYTLLVAVVLAAQVSDAAVNKATAELFRRADTPAKMAALGEARVRETIRTLSLYKGKARNVVALSRALVDKHGGEVPAERAALEALPGVGRKTANFVLALAHDRPTIAVDTHVHRVANRTSLAAAKTPLAVERALEAVVPARYRARAAPWLVLHGRYVCKARKPACPDCRIHDLCAYPDKTQA